MKLPVAAAAHLLLVLLLLACSPPCAQAAFSVLPPVFSVPAVSSVQHAQDFVDRWVALEKRAMEMKKMDPSNVREQYILHQKMAQKTEGWSLYLSVLLTRAAKCCVGEFYKAL